MELTINKDVAKATIDGFFEIDSRKGQLRDNIDLEVGRAVMVNFRGNIAGKEDTLNALIKENNIYALVRDYYSVVRTGDFNNDHSLIIAYNALLLAFQPIFKELAEFGGEVSASVARLLYDSCALNKDGSIKPYDKEYCRYALILADNESFMLL